MLKKGLLDERAYKKMVIEEKSDKEGRIEMLKG